jgi:hypothetical protein
VTKGNAFGSHKYAGKSALRYELGIDILVGNLVWIQGQYSAGKYTDIKFSTRFCVISSSRVSGSRPTRATAATPTKANPAENRTMQARVRARHKTLNGWLKNWGILSQVFRHHITMHGDVYRACVVVSRLTVEK